MNRKLRTTLTLAITMLLAFGFQSLSAQKYAFVDTEYILNNIPNYKAAQEEIDKLSTQYENEVKGLYDAIDKMYKEYQAEKVLLTDEMKSKREEQIITKEREAKKTQNDYFGEEGLLYKKREELIKPIQDEIYNAVEDISKQGNYELKLSREFGKRSYRKVWS